MDKLKHKVTLNADGKEISVHHFGGENDYISLTDIAKFKNPDDAFIVINNWMRSKDTILFLGLWEQLNNPDFKPIEFDRFKMEAGANAFTLSPQKWITATNAVGINRICQTVEENGKSTVEFNYYEFFRTTTC